MAKDKQNRLVLKIAPADRDANGAYVTFAEVFLRNEQSKPDNGKTIHFYWNGRDLRSTAVTQGEGRAAIPIQLYPGVNVVTAKVQGWGFPVSETVTIPPEKKATEPVRPEPAKLATRHVQVADGYLVNCIVTDKDGKVFRGAKVRAIDPAEPQGYKDLDPTDEHGLAAHVSKGLVNPGEARTLQYFVLGYPSANSEFTIQVPASEKPKDKPKVKKIEITRQRLGSEKSATAWLVTIRAVDEQKNAVPGVQISFTDPDAQNGFRSQTADSNGKVVHRLTVSPEILPFRAWADSAAATENLYNRSEPVAPAS